MHADRMENTPERCKASVIHRQCFPNFPPIALSLSLSGSQVLIEFAKLFAFKKRLLLLLLCTRALCTHVREPVNHIRTSCLAFDQHQPHCHGPAAKPRARHAMRARACLTLPQWEPHPPPFSSRKFSRLPTRERAFTFSRSIASMVNFRAAGVGDIFHNFPGTNNIRRAVRGATFIIVMRSVRACRETCAETACVREHSFVECCVRVHIYVLKYIVSECSKQNARSARLIYRTYFLSIINGAGGGVEWGWWLYALPSWIIQPLYSLSRLASKPKIYVHVHSAAAADAHSIAVRARREN